LLRNPAVVSRPLDAAGATAACRAFRTHPRWAIVENAPVMSQVWKQAAIPDSPRRRIFDVRIALTLLHHGVDEFATANVGDFEGLGFDRVMNPIS